MSNEVVVDIIEQHAIFEGTPDFIPLSAAICLVNHHSYGGTPNDMKEALNDKSLDSPKRYKVKLTLSYEEL